jgi:hypothetical protein
LAATRQPDTRVRFCIYHMVQSAGETFREIVMLEKWPFAPRMHRNNGIMVCVFQIQSHQPFGRDSCNVRICAGK